MSTKLDAIFRFSQDALNLRAYRQQLLASNIANADTPGYLARDIDFKAALTRAEAAQAQRANGDSAAAARDAKPVEAELLYRSVIQRSVDGNTVDVDVERAQFAENAVRYEADLLFVSSQVKALLAAIQG